jgi:hypothetical protein
MAYTYSYTGIGSPSTVLRSDGMEFSQDPGNLAYQEWVLFEAGGGTTTAAPVPTIGDLRAIAKNTAANRAADARSTFISIVPHDAVRQMLRFKEAMDYERFEVNNTNDADYVMLGAEIGTNGADVDEVHDAVLIEIADYKAGMAAIEGELIAVNEEIDDATDQTEINAALAALEFTTSDTI